MARITESTSIRQQRQQAGETYTLGRGAPQPPRPTGSVARPIPTTTTTYIPADTSNYVKVGNDWVSKADFDAMSPEEQAKLMSLGLAGYNAWVTDENKRIADETAKFEAEHVMLNFKDPTTGENVWLKKVDTDESGNIVFNYDTLSNADKWVLQNHGVDAYNYWRSHLRPALSSGVGITSSPYKIGEEETYLLYNGKPMTAEQLTSALSRIQPQPDDGDFLAVNTKLQTGEWVSAVDTKDPVTGETIPGLFSLPAKDQEILKKYGIDAYNTWAGAGKPNLSSNFTLIPGKSGFYDSSGKIILVSPVNVDVSPAYGGYYPGKVYGTASQPYVDSSGQVHYTEVPGIGVVVAGGQVIPYTGYIDPQTGTANVGWNDLTPEQRNLVATEGASALLKYGTRTSAAESVHVATMAGIMESRMTSAPMEGEEGKVQEIRPVLDRLKPFQTGVDDNGLPVHDIVAAIASGQVSENELYNIPVKDSSGETVYMNYGQEAVAEAAQAAAMMVTLESRFGTEGVDAEGNPVRGYAIGEAIVAKAINENVARNVFGAEAVDSAVAEYKSVEAALAKIDDPKYKTVNAQGEVSYNLLAIMDDKKLSPGEMVRVFGQTPEGKEALKSSIEQHRVEEEARIHQQYGGTRILANKIAQTYLDVVVPGVYTARTWNSMSAGERALNLAFDIISLAPVAGAAGKGARMVSVTGRTTKLARLSGAVKGLWTPKAFAAGLGKKQLVLPEGMLGAAIHEIAWPAHTVSFLNRPAKVAATTVRHPIKMGKVTKRTVGRTIRHPARALNRRMNESIILGSFKSLLSGVETVIRPTKLPEAVLTTTYGTVRMSVKATTTPEEAMRIRDTLMQLAVKGDRPVVEIGGVRYELDQSPLMTTLGGGAAHATPEGTVFDTLLEVTEKEGKPLREQGLFVSHEPLPRFGESSAYGMTGSHPTIRIFSPEEADYLVTTNKIYSGTAEMEMKFPVGTKIKPPAQKLFTRVGPQGIRMEIYLSKPLTKLQIAKLKFLGLSEQFRTLYSPALSIGGVNRTTGLTPEELEGLARFLDDIDPTVARNMRRVSNAVRSSATGSVRGVLSNLERTTSRARATGRTTLIRATGVARTDRPVIDVSYTRLSARANEPLRATVSRIVRGEGERLPPTRIELPRVLAPRADLTRMQPASRGIARPEIPRAGRVPRVITGVPQTPRVGTPRVPRVSADVPRVSIPSKDTAPPRIILPSGKGRRQTRVYPPGAVGWRQGKLRYDEYKIMYLDPKTGKVVLGRESVKPLGVEIHEGPESAYRSFRLLHGRVPAKMEHALGIMDITAVRGKKIHFKRVPSRIGTKKAKKPTIGRSK